MNRISFVVAAVALFATTSYAAEPKSGLQAGERVTAFNPLNVTGSSAGQKVCQVWKNGGNPVAVVFAREITPGLTSLVKKLDEAVVKNSEAKMGSFVVILTDDDKSEEKLKDMAEKEKIKKVVLCTDNPSGPEKWKIAKDADVTVLLYTKSTVKKNFAFEKGKMTDKDVSAILDAVKEILPEKKDK